MPQTSLAEYVDQLDRAKLLTRYKDEKRVDELPKLMEDNPDTAIFVEKVKDCPFPFLANAYGVRPMYALALDCDIKKVGIEIAERSGRREKPQVVKTAPCKDVILKGQRCGPDHLPCRPFKMLDFIRAEPTPDFGGHRKNFGSPGRIALQRLGYFLGKNCFLRKSKFRSAQVTAIRHFPFKPLKHGTLHGLEPTARICRCCLPDLWWNIAFLLTRMASEVQAQGVLAAAQYEQCRSRLLTQGPRHGEAN